MSERTIQKYKIFAKKSLWQNFLVDENILENIADCIDIEWKNILEVGPGYGALTEKLLEKIPTSLHLVELDTDMIDILRQEFHLSLTLSSKERGQATDFQIFHTDILKHTPSFEKYSVIANIPYYITSPILRHFLYTLETSPEKMLILMQQDVGDRILQKNKNKSSVLSLIVQKKCKISEQLLVPKESFIPVPKVESSVLLFETHNDFADINDEAFLKLIKAWFSNARKKCIKNLVAGWYDKQKILDFYEKNNLSENIRAEDLDVGMWCEMVNDF